MDKEKLKKLAIDLEFVLKNSENLSADLKALSKYEPLMSAIARAKKELISKPEPLPGMQYWLFETDLQNYQPVELAVAQFSNLLEGLCS